MILMNMQILIVIGRARHILTLNVIALVHNIAVRDHRGTNLNLDVRNENFYRIIFILNKNLKCVVNSSHKNIRLGPFICYFKQRGWRSFDFWDEV